MAAIQLDDTDPALPVRAVGACREAGVMTRLMAGGALQVSPPLTTTPLEVEEMANGFSTALGSL